MQIRNWQTHQAYTANRPSWIKLHVALRDDPDFTELEDAHKAHVIGLWMLAASAGKGGQHILRDNSWIAGVIRATSKVDIDALALAGFVSPCTCRVCKDSSKILDNPLESSTVEERRREEKRGEDKEHLSAGADGISGRAVVETETWEEGHADEDAEDLCGGTLANDGGDDPGAQLGDLRDGGSDRAQIEEVLAHFDAVTSRRFKRTDNRRKQVRARLKSYSVDDLKRAAESAAANPFYGGGQNKHKTRYDRPQTVYRSDETVEAHLEWLAENAVSSNGGAFDHLD